MTGNFIYVFSEELRDELIARGYTLLHSDDAAKRYVFANESTQSYSLGEGVVFSNQLTF